MSIILYVSVLLRETNFEAFVVVSFFVSIRILLVVHNDVVRVTSILYCHLQQLVCLVLGVEHAVLLELHYVCNMMA